MSSIAIRTAIADTLNQVTDIGMVQLHERYARNMDQMKTFYLSVEHEQLRGWFIRRVRMNESGNMQPRSVEITTWQIVGVMALDDDASSELVMDALIESIRDEFRASDTLGGVVGSTCLPNESQGGIQLDDFGPAKFANVLVHMARMTLNTVRYL